MRFVKRQLELSFCSNGLYRKETGNLDESSGYAGYLCDCLSHAFDVCLSTSAHFLLAFWLKYFKIPLCFFSLHYSSWQDAFYEGRAQKLKPNKETEAQKA